MLCLTLTIAACAPTVTPEQDETPAAPAPSESASAPEPTSAAPQLLPEGTAAENQAFFASIVAQVWASEQQGSSRAYVDALTAAGFPRDAMQVTNDTTTVDNPAESIQFSVRWGADECLIGQVGPSTGEPTTTVMKQVAEGRCLIGTTMPIDW